MNPYALRKFSALQIVVALGLAIGIPTYPWIAGALEDRWKEPYLQSKVYSLGGDCEKYLRVGNYMPTSCAPDKYMVSSMYYCLKYHLPQIGRSRAGWLRVGTTAAMIRLCTSECEVVQIIPNIFGQNPRAAH